MPVKATPPIERAWKYIEKTDSCWLWTGAKSHGYGRISNIPAHRVIYESVKGLIPLGLQIDHLCRVTNCVNPDHLEAVTPRDNTLRGIAPSAQCAKRTECAKGHPYNEVNTLYKTSGQRRRWCRVCDRLYYAAHYSAATKRAFGPRK